MDNVIIRECLSRAASQAGIDLAQLLPQEILADVAAACLPHLLGKIDRLEAKNRDLDREIVRLSEDLSNARNAILDVRAEHAADLMKNQDTFNRVAGMLIQRPALLRDVLAGEDVISLNAFIETGQKMEAIRLVRAKLHCGLKETKDLVEAYMQLPPPLSA